MAMERYEDLSENISPETPSIVTRFPNVVTGDGIARTLWWMGSKEEKGSEYVRRAPLVSRKRGSNLFVLFISLIPPYHRSVLPERGAGVATPLVSYCSQDLNNVLYRKRQWPWSDSTRENVKKLLDQRGSRVIFLIKIIMICKLLSGTNYLKEPRITVSSKKGKA